MFLLREAAAGLPAQQVPQSVVKFKNRIRLGRHGESASRSDAASNVIVLLTCESWFPEARRDDAFGESDQKVPPLFFFGLKFFASVT